jgi:hypothetical protein
MVVVPALAKCDQGDQPVIESSPVAKRREPQMCVAEVISQVACNPTTVRKKFPHNRNGRPPGQQH